MGRIVCRSNTDKWNENHPEEFGNDLSRRGGGLVDRNIRRRRMVHKAMSRKETLEGTLTGSR